MSSLSLVGAILFHFHDYYAGGRQKVRVVDSSKRAHRALEPVRVLRLIMGSQAPRGFDTGFVAMVLLENDETRCLFCHFASHPWRLQKVHWLSFPVTAETEPFTGQQRYSSTKI